MSTTDGSKLMIEPYSFKRIFSNKKRVVEDVEGELMPFSIYTIVDFFIKNLKFKIHFSQQIHNSKFIGTADSHSNFRTSTNVI